MTFSVAAAVLLASTATSCALSGFFLLQEIGEVNRQLPNTEQISYWGMYPGKMSRIRREYERLYPTGKIDIMRRLFQYAAFVFALFLLVPLGFFK